MKRFILPLKVNPKSKADVEKAHELLKQKNAVKLKGMIQIQEGVGGSLELKGVAQDLHPTVTSLVAPCTVPLENIDSRVDDPEPESKGCLTSVSSLFKESWATLLSYTKSQQQFPLYFTAAIVAIVILMQISIIILLTRVPEVHVVTQGNQISGLSGYRAENIEWLEKRVDNLKEEMLMVESRLERMHHEHSLLNKHLQSLERFKPKS
ncbi:uncharacterized protein A4U43_C04F32510 [Asparagus officinalis]|uniref:Uncharacterized protein n=1 Tax=Asparagus officinalis TaxID=4686 RepID=A0A5P1F5S3_ASPOF|nr:uncharacterized protein A4U43_C04F32510 [Asparagus officinalis]